MKKLLLGLAAVCLAAPIFAQDEVVKDPATYEKVGDYTFENLWIQSVATGNSENVVAASVSRGMAITEDELLYPYVSEFSGIKVYDLKTGAFKKDIKFDTSKFVVSSYKTDTLVGEKNDTTYSYKLVDLAGPGYLPNDVQVDDAGNVLVHNMVPKFSSTSGAQLAIWRIDMETGEPTKVMDLINKDGFLDGYRVDYFAVKGDVTKDAIVMFAVASNNLVIRCDIKDGQLVAQTEGDYAGYNFNVIEIKDYSPEGAENNGYAPRISIVDDELFYLDGFNSEASLYDMSGSLIESVSNAPEACHILNSKFGTNGVAEFTLNDKPFCAYTVSNNESSAEIPHAWKVIEMGAGPTFEGATHYWTFPANGMGTVSNPNRNALPRVATVTDKNGLEAAYIAVYAEANGTAVYKMTPDGFDAESESGVEDVVADNVNIYVAGDAIHFSGEADAVVYNFAGQQVSAANGVQTMAAPAAKGIYIVKAVIDGVQKVQKVVVK